MTIKLIVEASDTNKALVEVYESRDTSGAPAAQKLLLEGEKRELYVHGLHHVVISEVVKITDADITEAQAKEEPTT